jgi:hypothetical protein
MADKQTRRRALRGAQQLRFSLVDAQATNDERQRAVTEAAAILRGGHVQLKRPRAGLR